MEWREGSINGGRYSGSKREILKRKKILIFRHLLHQEGPICVYPNTVTLQQCLLNIFLFLAISLHECQLEWFGAGCCLSILFLCASTRLATSGTYFLRCSILSMFRLL